MRYVLKSWVESLQVFKPTLLKIFSLLMLKYTVDFYSRLWYFWWLLVGGATAALIVLPTRDAFITVFLLWLFYSLCSVRSSIELKQYRYFMRLSYYFIFYIVIAWLLYMTVRFFLLKALATHSIIINIIIGLLVHISSMGLLFFTLFMLDTYGTIADGRVSLQRAFRFVVYNYPFCLVITGIFIAIVIGGAGGTYTLFKQRNFYWILYGLLFLLAPFFSCFLANFYIKRVHEQFNLYFKDEK